MEMSQQQFKDMMETMLRTIVSEIRKPPVDPIKEAQKKRELETKNTTNLTLWAGRLAKLRRCSHSRQDGTCVIGWATQSDGVQRGYCPNCDAGVMIAPELQQLFPEYAEEMKKLYETQIRRPRGLMESVRYVA